MAKAKCRHQETYKGIKIDITAPTERDLYERVRRRKNDIDKGFNLDGESMTFSAWSFQWLSHYKKKSVSEPYFKAIESRMRRYVLPFIGNKKLRDIKPIDVQIILRELDDKSFSLVSHVKAELSECLAEAVNQQYIFFNPVTSIKTPKNEAGSHRALTDDERAVLLQACRGHFAGTWIKTMLYCGLRPQELSPLQWKDIDVDKHAIRVSKALKTDGTVGTTKSEAGVRSVPIPDVLYDELLSKFGKPTELIFQTNAKADGSCGGKMLNHKGIARWWKSIKKQMYLLTGARMYRNKLILIDEDGTVLHKVADDLTLYCLRHTYCTDLLRAGVPITSAKYLMGHSDTKMIDKIYGHHTQDQTDTAALLINGFLNHMNSEG